jgi:hypothetical protein
MLLRVGGHDKRRSPCEMNIIVAGPAGRALPAAIASDSGGAGFLFLMKSLASTIAF